MVTGAKIHDRIVPLSHELQSGDVVEILKSKTARPSLDWLNMVKTADARQKIKSWLSHHKTYFPDTSKKKGRSSP
jgi:GTP pyrophosphokinase